jgi:hypothetical protein
MSLPPSFSVDRLNAVVIGLKRELGELPYLTIAVPAPVHRHLNLWLIQLATA